MQYHSITTLNEIRAAGPCEGGWGKLLKSLGKTKADDAPLPLLTILESNGLDDALWCLRVPSLERLSRHFKAWCAEQVLHLFEAERHNDMRVRNQIAMLRNDDETDEERAAARDAASDAAWAAARDAASDAAWAAALDAAWASAMYAALAAAWASAMYAALAAAGAAARSAQERQLRVMLSAIEAEAA